MAQVKLRGISGGSFCAVLLLFAVPIAALCALCWWMYTTFEDSFAAVLLFFAVLAGPVLIYCVGVAMDYATYVEIKGDQIMFSRPFRKRKQMHIHNVTAYGQVAWVIKETKFYFCTADPDSIWQEFDAHHDVVEELFEKSRVTKLMETERGRWQMAVGVYIYRHPSDVFYLMDGSSPKRLQQIQKYMLKEPITTGAHSLDLEYGWYRKRFK